MSTIKRQLKSSGSRVSDKAKLRIHVCRDALCRLNKSVQVFLRLFLLLEIKTFVLKAANYVDCASFFPPFLISSALTPQSALTNSMWDSTHVWKGLIIVNYFSLSSTKFAFWNFCFNKPSFPEYQTFNEEWLIASVWKKMFFFHFTQGQQWAQHPLFFLLQFLSHHIGEDGVKYCTVHRCWATRALLVYFQPRFCQLLRGFKPVMQIQWNERDGAALHGPGLRLMKLQSCGLLHQQKEAPSTSGLNTSMMIRLPRLKAMTHEATLGHAWWK